LRLQGLEYGHIHIKLYLILFYKGTNTTLIIMTPQYGSDNHVGEFIEQFYKEYEFEHQKKITITSDVRVHGVGVNDILNSMVMEKTIRDPK